MNQTSIQVYEDYQSNSTVYKITIPKYEYNMAKLSPIDYALLDDIDNGEPSSTPLADKLLGLEMIVRRIEESRSRGQFDE